MSSILKATRTAKNFVTALKNTGNTAIGINKGERTAIAKHDVHHGTNFWQHISNNDFNKAETSLNQMKNPALKETGQTLLRSLKIANKVRGGKTLVSALGGTYRRAGLVLGKAVGAKDMTEELKKYENARTNENNNNESQDKHKIQIEQEAHFENATQETISKLQKLLDNKVLNDETRKTISEALKIITAKSPEYESPKVTGVSSYPTTASQARPPQYSSGDPPNYSKGGSSCSRKHKKSRKSRKGKKGKNGKRVTRKHRGGAKKTRKSNKNTKRKQHKHRRTKRKC